MTKPAEPNGDRFLSATVTVPNILSAFRILLVPLFVGLVLSRDTLRPLIVFCLAGMTDIFDGFIARRLHQRSKLGLILDPAGDKLLMAASYILLALPGVAGPNRIPVALTIVVFGRDLMISAGVLWAYLSLGVGPALPLVVGKLTTAFQVGTAFLVLLTNHLGEKAGWLTVFFLITGVLTLTSWIFYLLRGLSLVRRRTGSGPAVSRPNGR